ncbi:tRNA (adenosine(37)-N6)-threonylcarbamoyltransferase complex dimerization subunit type 1 TsaB [Candidatus Omnitrophota bacterium]
MKILGIDTSSKILSIVLSEDPSNIIEDSHLLDRKHSSLLVPKVKELLQKAGLSIDDVDAFVVGLGPGSFTGLRIGVSAAKGFGIATRKPCIGVSSIDALALNVDFENSAIVPVIDAKRQQVYSAIYRKEKGRIVKKSNHLLMSVHKLMKRIKGRAVFLGDGITLYRENIYRLNKKAVFLGEEYWYPKASNLITLALTRMKKYKKGDLSKLKPIYLYPKDCQVRKD